MYKASTTVFTTVTHAFVIDSRFARNTVGGMTLHLNYYVCIYLMAQLQLIHSQLFNSTPLGILKFS